MATPADDSRVCASGGVIAAGRHIAPTIAGITWTPDRDASGNVITGNWLGLPLNSWVEVAGQVLNDVIQTPHYLDAGGGDSADGIIGAWGGMAWDHQNRRGYIYGGGHGDSSACETGIYCIDAVKLTFSRVRDRDPMAYVQGWNGSVLTPSETWSAGHNAPLTNGWPGSIHSYHSLVWIPPSWMGNTAGGLLIMGNAKTLYNIDTGTSTATHWNSPTTQSFDISNMAAFMDGNAFYGPRAAWNHWKYDTTANQASEWSAGSYGTFAVSPISQDKQSNVGSAIWGLLRERREEFSLSSTAFTRTRYGQAIDASATNWSAYSDTITLTSSDGSHADFSSGNLASDSMFSGGGSAYDHATSTLYVMRNDAGGQMYKITGLSGNTWATEKVTGTGATRATMCTYGRFRMFDIAGHKIALRVTSKDHPIQVMRVS